MVDWALIQTYQMIGESRTGPDDLTKGAYSTD